ncbi:DUF5712 family protein [Spirosoma utsteinense]|uniref:Uncharacterized protein n=1 Tax=Spirosoma utsteinense TaxID=2585773 RepID=A0ABR6WEH9_9BACT|nr:DUF5712 family protein [Spirosoma utsteinense]MBC3794960.1 hypothetical protein [Spirosoma utsteinense]
MQTKFSSPIKGNNKGGSTRLVAYLEKENVNKLVDQQEYFFSADRDKCNKYGRALKVDIKLEKEMVNQQPNHRVVH